MDFVTISKLVFTLLGSITISGAVLWWFIKLTANTLADNYKKQVEHGFEKKLEFYKSEIDILKATTLKYNDKQFDLYLNLWKNLQDLKFACFDLWDAANHPNLRKFDLALKKTHRQIETTSILLEETHYKELSEIIRNFQEYDTGKEKLIAAVKSGETQYFEIVQIIEYNRARKDKCLEIIETMKSSIQQKIRGNM